MAIIVAGKSARPASTEPECLSLVEHTAGPERNGTVRDVPGTLDSWAHLSGIGRWNLEVWILDKSNHVARRVGDGCDPDIAADILNGRD